MSKKQDENKNEGTHDNNNVLLVFFNCTVIYPIPKPKKSHLMNNYYSIMIISALHIPILFLQVCASAMPVLPVGSFDPYNPNPKRTVR